MPPAPGPAVDLLLCRHHYRLHGQALAAAAAVVLDREGAPVWWRREGHVLHLEDLGTLLDRHLERLVVGTGAYGRMRPAPGLEQELAARGVTVEVLPTAAAVDRINELLRVEAVDWASALHLTC